jgi:multidrug resistance efflux pump
VQEGDQVKAGQVLMVFDDKELQASLEGSRANAEKAKRGYRPEEIQEGRAAAMQAKADYQLKKNGYRKEDIAAAQADLDRAAADETRSNLDFRRYEALAKKDLVSKQQRDTAEANWKMALAQKKMLSTSSMNYNEVTVPKKLPAPKRVTCKRKPHLTNYSAAIAAKMCNPRKLPMPTMKRDSGNAKCSRLAKPPWRFLMFGLAI